MRIHGLKLWIVHNSLFAELSQGEKKKRKEMRGKKNHKCILLLIRDFSEGKKRTDWHRALIETYFISVHKFKKITS